MHVLIHHQKKDHEKGSFSRRCRLGYSTEQVHDKQFLSFVLRYTFLKLNKKNILLKKFKILKILTTYFSFLYEFFTQTKMLDIFEEKINFSNFGNF